LSTRPSPILGLGQRSCKVISIGMFYPYIYIGPFKLYINGYIYIMIYYESGDPMLKA